MSESPEMHRLEARVSLLLRAGVVLASLVVLVGLIATLVSSGSHEADTKARLAALVRSPHDLERALDPIGSLAAHLGTGHPDAIIDLGLILLMLTPVARVAVTLLLFAQERDWKYVLIAGFVLAMLALSVVGGFKV